MTLINRRIARPAGRRKNDGAEPTAVGMNSIVGRFRECVKEPRPIGFVSQMMETIMKPPRKKARIWVRVIRVLALVYVGLCIAGCMFQNNLIFPGASTQGTPEARVKTTGDQELIRIETSNGDTIYSLFTPTRDDGPHRPTLILFYGNGMCMADCLGIVDEFRRLGTNVAVVEFPGYGMSSGKPGEKSIFAAAEAAYDVIAKRTDVDPKQIIPVGISIGGGAAIHLASVRPVAGVTTFSAFTNLPEVAHHLFPYLPTSLLIRYRFDNEATLQKLDVPAFLAHGTADELVPFSMNGRLVKAAKKSVTYSVQGAGHNDVFERGGSKLMAAFGEFIERVAGSVK